jgi:hypothetical protein
MQKFGAYTTDTVNGQMSVRKLAKYYCENDVTKPKPWEFVIFATFDIA